MKVMITLVSAKILPFTLIGEDPNFSITFLEKVLKILKEYIFDHVCGTVASKTGPFWLNL